MQIGVGLMVSIVKKKIKQNCFLLFSFIFLFSSTNTLRDDCFKQVDPIHNKKDLQENKILLVYFNKNKIEIE